MPIKSVYGDLTVPIESRISVSLFPSISIEITAGI